MSVICIQGVGNRGMPEEVKRVHKIDFSSGEQAVVPTQGYTMSKVLIDKPEGLKPENIKFGVEICGIVGTHIDEDIIPIPYEKIRSIFNKNEE